MKMVGPTRKARGHVRSWLQCILIFTAVAVTISAQVGDGTAEQKTALAQSSLEMRVERSLVGKPIHGMPYDETRSLGPEALPLLRRALNDRDRADVWANACTAIGYIGSPQGFAILRQFISKQRAGVKDRKGLTTLVVAIQASGFCATGAPAARQYFQSAVDPTFWMDIDPQLPGYDHQRTALLLAKNNVIALGYVQEPWAAEQLEAIRTNSASKHLRQAAVDAAGTWQEIERNGVALHMRHIQRRLSGEEDQ